MIRRWGNILAGLLRWIGSVLLIACKLRMHVVPWSNVFNLVLLLFVLAASCARWYVLLVVWRCWKGLSGLMVNPMSASVVSTPGKAEHGCIANPLASLHPYLSSEGAMVFESARAWECVSAKQFDKIRESIYGVSGVGRAGGRPQLYASVSPRWTGA